MHADGERCAAVAIEPDETLAAGPFERPRHIKRSCPPTYARAASSRPGRSRRSEAFQWHMYASYGVGRKGRDANSGTDLMQILAQLADERVFGECSGDQPPIVRQRIKGTEEAKALDELAYERVYRHHALSFQLAQRNENGPLIRAAGME